MNGQIYLSDNQLVLKCDEALGKYLRFLFRRTFGRKLQAPSRGSHIVVTFPGESFTYKDGILGFELDNNLFTNGNAYWVNVISKDIENFRASLGLGRPPRDIHYCVGYERNV